MSEELNADGRKTAIAFAAGGVLSLVGMAASAFLLVSWIGWLFVGFGASGLIGGLLAGMRAGLGLFSSIAFGLGLVLPGLVCPFVAVASQAMSGGGVWLMIGVPLWAVAFGMAGAFGASSLGLSDEGFRRVSTGFLVGGAVGGGLLVVAPFFGLLFGQTGALLGVAGVWLVPWYVGGRALGRSIAEAPGELGADDVTDAAGRAMLNALLRGNTDPVIAEDLARAGLREELPVQTSSTSDAPKPPSSVRSDLRVDPAARGGGVLRDNETGQLLGKVSATEFQFLGSQLERESEADDAYYIDVATIDMIEQHGAPRSLTTLLRQSLGARGAIEVAWSQEEVPATAGAARRFPTGKHRQARVRATRESKINISASIARRRKRNKVAFAAMLFLAVTIAAFDPSSVEALGFVLLCSYIGFSFWNLRCPSCGWMWGGVVYRYVAFCDRCGVAFQPQTASAAARSATLPMDAKDAVKSRGKRIRRMVPVVIVVAGIAGGLVIGPEYPRFAWVWVVGVAAVMYLVFWRYSACSRCRGYLSPWSRFCRRCGVRVG